MHLNDWLNTLPKRPPDKLSWECGYLTAEWIDIHEAPELHVRAADVMAEIFGDKPATSAQADRIIALLERIERRLSDDAKRAA